MLLRVPAVVCHDHRREMAGEWAAGEIAVDRRRAAPPPTMADTKGAREQVSTKYPLGSDVSLDPSSRKTLTPQVAKDVGRLAELRAVRQVDAG
jgi:hypothetical protein